MTARWREITAGEIVSALQGARISGSRKHVFRGLSTDSRQISQGYLFWALKGEKYDGHDFALKAVENGASGLVLERDCPSSILREEISVIYVQDTLKALGDLAAWWRAEHHVAVIAVTGSAGKTTTKEMTASILQLSNETLKSKGNFNNLIGVPLTLLSLDDRHKAAVLEIAMNRPGEIGRLTEIADPSIGVITNVGKAHLEGVGDLKGVARAKVELLEKISPDALVVLNGDDQLLMEAASPFNRKKVTFGLGPKNDLRADKVQNMGPKGLSFELQYGEKTVAVKLNVPGIQNLFNALAASAVAFCLDKPAEQIAEGLRLFRGIQGRFTVSELAGGATLVDDTYNANPLSLNAAMQSLKSFVLEKGKLIVGLGEMLELGEETKRAHFEAGSLVAESGASYFLAFGDHAQEMVRGAAEKGFPPEKTFVATSHSEMAEKIRELIARDDVVFLKGSRLTGLDKVVDLLKN